MANKKYTIMTYLDDGRVFKYEVDSQSKVREHCAAIAKTGYRTIADGSFTHYPPHRVLKVKCPEIMETQYPDEVTGT